MKFLAYLNSGEHGETTVKRQNLVLRANPPRTGGNLLAKADSDRIGRDDVAQPGLAAPITTGATE